MHHQAFKLRTSSLDVSPKPARYIAMSAIFPKIFYGSQIWWLKNTASVRPLEISFYRTDRLIIGFPKALKLQPSPHSKPYYITIR
jgi:hypothetical protein